MAAALLATTGCTTYVIDSNPQGLRVSVNNIEEGFTPCRYFLWSQFYYPLEVTVAPPQPRQLEAYAAERNVSVQAITTPQTKVLTPRSPSGTVYFDFIATERTSRPNTPPDHPTPRACRNAPQRPIGEAGLLITLDQRLIHRDSAADPPCVSG